MQIADTPLTPGTSRRSFLTGAAAAGAGLGLGGLTGASSALAAATTSGGLAITDGDVAICSSSPRPS